jgi:hypothetical protein
MMRLWPKCLLCTLVGLALVLSGFGAAAARLTMAVEAASTTEVVICGDAGARLVRLDGQGTPLAPASDSCATCPDCMAGTAFAPPGPPAIATPMLGQGAALSVPCPVILPARVLCAVQARAPPKGV